MLLQRARPLLGTLVTLQVRRDVPGREPMGELLALQAMDAAFDVVSAIERAMSAHRHDSDLARIARAQPGTSLQVGSHTTAVLLLAMRWQRDSRGAFDPAAAGARLAARGLRPGLGGPLVQGGGQLQDIHVGSASRITLAQPVRLDLGGIAKGYAVDQAVQVLRAYGVASGLVNAGGDLRAFGPHAWAVDIRHPSVQGRSRRLGVLRQAALASSVAGADNPEFIPTARRRGAMPWQHCTVLARDCASADALTKWALQAPGPSLSLRAALREQGGRLWRC